MPDRQALLELIAQLPDRDLPRVRAYVDELLREHERATRERWSLNLIDEFHQAKVSAQREPAGMEVKVGDATCGGETRRALWEHPPVSGAAIVSYAVPIPRNLKAVTLTLSVGIRDGSQLPDDRYIAFRVLVNGWKLWSVVKNTRAWDDYEIKMPELASDVARIEFQTDGLGDHRWNWAVWGEPKLIADS